jgi:hypothetical protein
VSQPHNAALEAASRPSIRGRKALHDQFLNDVELAKIYLDDGALISATRALRRIADALEAEQLAFNAALDRHFGEKSA